MAFLVPVLAMFLIPLVSGSHLTNKIFKWNITEPVGYISVGKRLDGHWFYQGYKKDVSLCAYQCLRQPQCLSFNYEKDSSKCILNRKNHVTAPLTNAASNYVSYHAREEYSIDREALGPCADDVCHSHGRCLETKTTGDQLVAICVCNKGWGGSDCSTTKPEPQWGAWQDWDDCSVTCDQGWRLRRRNCEDGNSGQTLSPLECYGRDIEYGSCQLQACPRWDSWGEWGTCTTYQTCGRGYKVRNRSCNNGGTPGVDRYCLGPTNETTVCHSMDCQSPIRLRGGSAYGEGRVEIFNDEVRQWGKICGDQWTQGMADLVCKHLGMPGAHDATQDSRFGAGDVMYGVTSLSCHGGERTVQMCERNPWSLTSSCPGLTEPAGVMCKVNGVWSLWGEWGECSVTCESGIQQRTRSCNHPPALHGGNDCVGETEQTRPCTLDMCPVDGVWETWAAWSECSTSCGKGSQWRERTCDGPFYDGKECQGERRQTQECQIRECPVDGVWNGWETWGDCSNICGGGMRSRTRTCQGPFFQGAPCPGEVSHTEECNTFECPVDGSWLPWHDWRDCSVTCGGGQQIRKRDCLKPKFGGSNCEGESQQTRQCSTQECPVDSYWLPWEQWGECNTTCGGGNQRRLRTCQEGLNGGRNCNGPAEDFQTCNTHACPVDGVWREWNEWSACSRRCDTGTQTRNRTCDGPYFGGSDCVGPTSDLRNCNTHTCAVDGVWKHWSDWSICPVTCGGGTSRRSRSCDGPYFGGINCSGLWSEGQPCGTEPCPIDGVWETWSKWSSCPVTCGGSMSRRSRSCDGPRFGGKNCSAPWLEEKTCGTVPCPIDGVWEPWSEWSVCPVSCGGSTSQRSRSCLGPHFGGKNCSAPWTEAKPCGTDHCPIDGEWTTWSTWGLCNVTCGGGSQSRSRTCIEPKFGGKVCEGDGVQLKGCNDIQCPIDGVFQTWEEWGACSVTCGGGEKIRSRKCTGPFHGGRNCTGPWEDKATCGTASCPVLWWFALFSSLPCRAKTFEAQLDPPLTQLMVLGCPGARSQNVTLRAEVVYEAVNATVTDHSLVGQTALATTRNKNYATNKTAQSMANGRTGRFGEPAALHVAEEYSGVTGDVLGHFGVVRTVWETLKSPVTATHKAVRRMGTSTIGLNGVSVTSHAAEGYAGEIERVMVRSMAVPTVMVRGTKARLVTITTAQLMASSTIGQTGVLAVPHAEVVINCVSAPAMVHSSAVKIALVHVKTQRRATNITALWTGYGRSGQSGARARSRAEGGSNGGQGTVSDRLMVVKNVQALATSLKPATQITAPLTASTVNGPHGEHAVTRVAEAHKIGLGRAPPLNMVVSTA
ncbi:SCO-spondin-like [Haliotis rubra]|uniref:SCO-spondin-like n=1 Tax=Haliotis rubra TaxID=36100 RepID=UPI001EE54119|nr:SCO-spondin-like [Haliotis rubra]